MGPFLFTFRGCFPMPHLQSKEKKLCLDVPWYLFIGFKCDLRYYPTILEITLLPRSPSHLAPYLNWRGIFEAWSVQVFFFFFLQTFFTHEDHMENWPLVMYFSPRAPEPSGVKLLHLILRLIFISCKMLQVCTRMSLSSRVCVCVCVCIERFWIYTDMHSSAGPLSVCFPSHFRNHLINHSTKALESYKSRCCGPAGWS